MNYSINISRETLYSNLHEGAVLVSEDNKLLCSAFTGEKSNLSWYSILLRKIKKFKISSAKSIYITINTLTRAHGFALLEVLTEIRVNEIYVGLPDPVLTYYMDNDPIITYDYVYRYPDKLQREILKLNAHYYANSTQNIKNVPYYSENRISNMFIEYLGAMGYKISLDELSANKKITAVTCND